MAQGSFRRWQGRSLDQKSNTSSLLLGLSGAGLAFAVSLLASQHTYIGCLRSFLFHIHAIAQLFSIGAGVLFSINRVRDFDLTAKIARLREEDPNAPNV